MNWHVNIVQLADKMIQLCQVAVLLLAVGTSQAGRQFIPLFEREARSLRDTFPFNAADLSQHNNLGHRQDRQVSNNSHFVTFLFLHSQSILYIFHFITHRNLGVSKLFLFLQWPLPMPRGKGNINKNMMFLTWKVSGLYVHLTFYSLHTECRSLTSSSSIQTKGYSLLEYSSVDINTLIEWHFNKSLSLSFSLGLPV